MSLFSRGDSVASAHSASGADPFVSVVVPVYNTARYLRQCLDSLVQQSLKNIEIICVNDGSTDDSPQILAEYAACDPRIRVISKPNGGYGHTMNRGFAEARGEYVGILESDDFADPHMYRDLYRFAHKHALDLVKTNYYEHSEQGDVKRRPWKGFRYRRVFDPRSEQAALKVLPIIWAALYRRQLIVDNDIRFSETPGASYQDTSFVHQVWMSARRVALLPGAYVHYRVDNASSSVKSSSKVFEVCKEYGRSYEFMHRDPDRVRAFASILNRLKWDTYHWNYNRISDDLKPQFADRMAQEFRAAREEGSLRSKDFAPEVWEKLCLLMDDTEAFKRRYATGL